MTVASIEDGNDTDIDDCDVEYAEDIVEEDDEAEEEVWDFYGIGCA